MERKQVISMAGDGEPDGREAAAACALIRAEIAAWAGVCFAPGPLPGSTEIRHRRKLLGHVYAVWGKLGMADVVFSPAVGEALIASGRAEPHPMFPGLGWVTAPIRQPADAATA